MDLKFIRNTFNKVQDLKAMIDASDSNAMLHLETVEKTLDSIGATQQPRLIVLNKMDEMPSQHDALVWTSRFPNAIQLSSITGDGVGALEEEVRGFVVGPIKEIMLSLPTASSKAIDFIEKRTEIVSRDWTEDQTIYELKVGQHQIEKMMSLCHSIMINGKPAKDMLERLWPNQLSARSYSNVPPHRFHV